MTTLLLIASFPALSAPGENAAPLNKQNAAGTSETSSADPFVRENIVDAFIKNIAALNLYRPMEPAGSRGSIGIGMGLGAQTTEQTNYDELHKSELGVERESTSATKRTGNKFYFVKGLFAPVDVGLTAAAFEGTNVKSVGAHLQITIFEGFQLPAVSLRFSHAHMFGLQSSALSSNAMDVSVSYGFLRYFTLYGGSGIARHSASVKLTDNPETAWLLKSTETSASIDSEYDDPYQFAGLAVRFLPPFISGAVETGLSGNGLETLAAKISIGL